MLSTTNANPTVLAGASLIDGTGAPVKERSWVHISGDRIVAIGQGDPPDPPNATRIDLAGRTVLPGLSDMHVHLGPAPQAKWMLALFVAHGVTMIKETGNTLGNLAGIRRWLAEEPVAPRVFVSGATMNGNENEERFLLPGKPTAQLLENNWAFGVDFLKVHNWISTAAFDQIARFAITKDIPLTGHVPLSMTSVAAIDRGMTILEHVRLHPGEAHEDPALASHYPMDLRVMRRTAHWAFFDPNNGAIRRTLDAWEARKDRMFLDPTIVVQEVIANADRLDTIRGLGRELLTEELRAGSAKAAHGYTSDLGPEEFTNARGSVDGMVKFVGLARERGIRILTGTDADGPLTVAGATLLRELEHLVRAGLSPIEAVHASTGAAAAALRDPERGVLRAGARADIVVARGSVATDIKALRDIELVVLGGHVHSREELLSVAAGLADDAKPAAAPPDE